MVEKRLLAQLQNAPLLLDGAMGTLLLARGVRADYCLEALVVENPALVTAIHIDYLDAGADIITTHTFGANCMRLAHFGLEEQVHTFNTLAVRLAQTARAGVGRACWIAGNVGPVGKRVDWDDAGESAAVFKAFHAQIGTLVESEVDLLLFETFSDVAELAVAVEVARRLCTLPIVASMSYDAQQMTLAGQRIEDATARLMALDVDVIGANCSLGPDQMVATLQRMLAAAPAASLCVSPNAGLPKQGEDRQMRYPVGAEEFASYAARYVELGASMVGGCCGTTPVYTTAMRRLVDGVVR